MARAFLSEDVTYWSAGWTGVSLRVSVHTCAAGHTQGSLLASLAQVACKAFYGTHAFGDLPSVFLHSVTQSRSHQSLRRRLQQNGKPCSTVIVNPIDTEHDHGASDGDGIHGAATGHRRPHRMGEVRSGRPFRTLHDSPARTAWRRWLAVHLPICRVGLVSPSDDPGVVVWHVRMVGRNSVEPCHHSDRFVCWLARWRPAAPARFARCQGQDGATQRRWRDVSFAAWQAAIGTALVMITHEGVDRHEVEDVLCQRWPDIVVKELEQEEPAVAMSAGCCRSWPVPPRCRTVEDRGHAPARPAGSPRQSSNRCRFLCDGRPPRLRRHHDHPDMPDHPDRLPCPGWSGWSHRSDLFTNPPC